MCCDLNSLPNRNVTITRTARCIATAVVSLDNIFNFLQSNEKISPLTFMLVKRRFIQLLKAFIALRRGQSGHTVF